MLVGDGPEKQRLINKVKENNIRNVTFLDSVGKDEVPYILNNANVCVSIVKKSKVHRFGISMNKLFDYMASGKPMISALEACFDFAEVAKCGIAVPPDDPEKLASAVLQMSQMSLQERESLGRNGRIYVEENHEFKILTDKLIEVIEKPKPKDKKEWQRTEDIK